jgi:hypothetical protein
MKLNKELNIADYMSDASYKRMLVDGLTYAVYKFGAFTISKEVFDHALKDKCVEVIPNADVTELTFRLMDRPKGLE